MKGRFSKKFLSAILTVCLTATLFFCLTGVMPVSAANTDMMYFNNTNQGFFLNYRPSGAAFEANQPYLYSFDLHYTVSINDSEYNYWRINYINTSSSPASISYSNLNIVKKPITNGYHYDITFNAPSDARDYMSVSLIFGDYYYNGRNCNYKFGNLDLWKLDSNGDKLSQIVCTMPDSTSSFVSLAKSGNTSANARARTGQDGKWCYPQGYMGTAVSISAQNGYFDPLPLPQMVHFPAGVADSGQLIGYKGPDTTFPAGRYRFTVDECAVGGIKSEVILRYSNFSAGKEITRLSDVLTGTSRVVEFQNYSDKSGGFLLMMGNYYKGIAMDTYLKNPELYKLDSNGDPTGENLVADFMSDNISLGAYAPTSSPRGKWTTFNYADGRVSYAAVDENCFIISQMVHFPAGYNNNQTLIYKNTTASIAAGCYKLTMDEASVDNKCTVDFLVDAGSENYKLAKNYDILDGKTRTIEFQLGSARTGFAVRIGNISLGTNFDTYIKNISLYKLSASGGNTQGSNLITDFKSNNINLVSGKTMSDYGTFTANKWTSLNYTAGSIISDNIDSSCFPSGAARQIHINTGTDYPGIVYKSNETITGSYRLTFDECTKTGVSIECYLELPGVGARSADGFKHDGTTRTLNWTLGGSYNYFTLVIANSNGSSNIDSYIKNIAFYKLDGSGNPTGDNLLADFTNDNIYLKHTTSFNDGNFTGTSKNNAVAGKWCIINYNGSNISFNAVNNSDYTLVNNGGDFKVDGNIDVYDYVLYKQIMLTTPTAFTPLSKDCTGDGYANGLDFQHIRETLLVG